MKWTSSQEALSECMNTVKSFQFKALPEPIQGQDLISLQVIDNKGGVINIETSTYYILNLKTKLFSPQA